MFFITFILQHVSSCFFSVVMEGKQAGSRHRKLLLQEERTDPDEFLLKPILSSDVLKMWEGIAVITANCLRTREVCQASPDNFPLKYLQDESTL